MECKTEQVYQVNLIWAKIREKSKNPGRIEARNSPERGRRKRSGITIKANDFAHFPREEVPIVRID